MEDRDPRDEDILLAVPDPRIAPAPEPRDLLTPADIKAHAIMQAALYRTCQTVGMSLVVGLHGVSPKAFWQTVDAFDLDYRIVGSEGKTPFVTADIIVGHGDDQMRVQMYGGNGLAEQALLVDQAINRRAR